ncbi:hypothetical protein GOV10_00605, partial [Candidatus Woesearchaeota archaeon]|nr:hypothetical protein [Candidatus Woesearchaeota archaeon]
PLPHEFMLAGIIGFFVALFQGTQWMTAFFSLFIVAEEAAKLASSMNLALIIIFLLLIVASIVSVSTKEIDESTLDIIAGEEYQSKKRKTLKKH